MYKARPKYQLFLCGLCSCSPTWLTEREYQIKNDASGIVHDSLVEGKTRTLLIPWYQTQWKDVPLIHLSVRTRILNLSLIFKNLVLCVYVYKCGGQSWALWSQVFPSTFMWEFRLSGLCGKNLYHMGHLSGPEFAFLRIWVLFFFKFSIMEKLRLP